MSEYTRKPEDNNTKAIAERIERVTEYIQDARKASTEEIKAQADLLREISREVAHHSNNTLNCEMTLNRIEQHLVERKIRSEEQDRSYEVQRLEWENSRAIVNKHLEKLVEYEKYTFYGVCANFLVLVCVLIAV